jgi:hypothetical protein
MDHSAALREPLSINLHCTGSKDGYGSAVLTQSCKNLGYHPKSGFDAGELIVKCFNDNNSTKFLYQPMENTNQMFDADVRDNTPTQHSDWSAALRESLSINLHCTGNKDDFESAAYVRNLDCHSKSGFDPKK